MSEVGGSATGSRFSPRNRPGDNAHNEGARKKKEKKGGEERQTGVKIATNRGRHEKTC